jgi:type I restriction enzyme S subunit
MPADWKQYRWGDLATLEYGKGITGYENVVGNYPVYGTNGQIGWHTEPLYNKAGVIVGRKGAYRGIHYSKKPFFVIDTAFYLYPKIEFDARWAYYQLLTMDINSMDSGSAIPSTSRPDFYALPVLLPPLPEQLAIANVLGSLDDKIELNRCINATLEALVAALFNRWFVDNPEAKGWEVGKLGDLCDSTIGGDWGEDQEFENSLPVICLRGVDLENLRKNGYSEDAPIRWINKLSLEKRLLSDCDILIAGSGIGPVGRSLWVGSKMLKAFSYPVIYSNFVKRFRAKSPVFAVYIDRILFNMRKSNVIWDYINGTSIPNLNDKDLLAYHQISIPSEKLVKDFYNFVILIYNKLYNGESRKLANLRDALLPRLMRGEVRIRTADGR